MGTRYIKWKGYTVCIFTNKITLMEDVSIFSQWTCYYNSQLTIPVRYICMALMQLISKIISHKPGHFEFSDSTEIGGILQPNIDTIFPTKSLLWKMFLFSPSGPATTIHNSSQYLALMQLISKIISHKPGHLSFPILLKYCSRIYPFSPTCTKSLLWKMFLFSPSAVLQMTSRVAIPRDSLKFGKYGRCRPMYSITIIIA